MTNATPTRGRGVETALALELEIDTLELRLPTVLWQEEAPCAPAWEGVMLSLVALAGGGGIDPQLGLTLTVAEAKLVVRWLRQAGQDLPQDLSPRLRFFKGTWAEVLETRHALVGESAEDEESTEPDVAVDIVEVEGAAWGRLVWPWDAARGLLLSAEGARKVADALESAMEELEKHPPRVFWDHTLGAVTGLGTDGSETELRVYVETAVSDADQPRIALDFLGTWWIDPEVEGLIEALRRASEAGGEGVCLALKDASDTEPWLRVSTRCEPDGARRVIFRLFDELVAERGDDGVVLLTPEAVARFAALLAEAVAWKRANAPYIFQAPEPLGRTVARVVCRTQG